MTVWSRLLAELDGWAACGQMPSFWWRDDDARTDTPALARLLGLSAHHGVPLALSVIPAEADGRLARRLDRGGAGVDVLQHGYAHRNHAAPGTPKAELSGARPPADTIAELASGDARLRALLGPIALDVLVPPWNRIDQSLIPLLPGLGFTGLSVYHARPTRSPVPGLVVTNTHADIIDWTGTRGFVGEERAVTAIVDHLSGRRAGMVDAAEPTGILTHHLVQDAACWRFLDQLLSLTQGSGRAKWCAARDLFPSRS